MTNGSRRRKATRDLRKFGVTMFVAFGLVALLLWWRDASWWGYSAGISAVFLLLGLLAPGMLRPIERAWMALAVILGAVMTRIVLTVGFFAAVTPTALVMRFRKKDLLNLRFDRHSKTYWEPVEPDGPATRPTKPY